LAQDALAARWAHAVISARGFKADAMAGSVIEQGMLESLQQQDREIEHIVVFSRFVVAYLLQQDGPNPGWRKANIEGPVYLVRRKTVPRYQVLVKSQVNTNDLLDNIHPDWELDCQKNYVFYKVEDPTKRIRGLWFHEDQERQRIESALEKTLEEIRTAPQAEPQVEPMPAKPKAAPPPEQPAPVPVSQPLESAQVDSLYTQFGLASPEPAPQESVTVTLATLRSALHSLADDDAFLKMVMLKLKAPQVQ